MTVLQVSGVTATAEEPSSGSPFLVNDRQSSPVKAKGNYTVQWVEGSGFKFCFCVLSADSCSFQMLVCCQPHGRGNPTERVMGRPPQEALGPAERAVNSPSGQGDRKHLRP